MSSHGPLHLPPPRRGRRGGSRRRWVRPGAHRHPLLRHLRRHRADRLPRQQPLPDQEVGRGSRGCSSTAPTSFAYPVDGWGYEEVGEVVEVGAEVRRRRASVTGSGAPGVTGPSTVQDGRAGPASGCWRRRRSRGSASSPRSAPSGSTWCWTPTSTSGETVAVFGLGVPGQIVAQLARLNGARVIGVDGIAARRELASELGADVVLDAGRGRGRRADPRADRRPRRRRLPGGDRQLPRPARGDPFGGVQLAGLRRRLHAGRRRRPAAGRGVPPQPRAGGLLADLRGLARRCSTAGTATGCARTAIDLAVAGPAAADRADLPHACRSSRRREAFRLLDEHPEQALQVVLSFDVGRRRRHERPAGRPGVDPARRHPARRSSSSRRGCGFDGIELSGPGDGSLRRPAPPSSRRAREAGVVMSSAVMHTDVFLGDFDPARRRRAIDELKELLTTVAEAGGLRGGQPQRVRRVLAASCRRTPRRAARRTRVRPWSRRWPSSASTRSAVGAEVFLEPLNRYEDYLVNTLADAVSIVDEVESPGVAVIADTYHMSIEEADCAASIIARRRPHPARPARRQQPARAGRRSLRLAGHPGRAGHDRLRRLAGHGVRAERPRRRRAAPGREDAPQLSAGGRSSTATLASRVVD